MNNETLRKILKIIVNTIVLIFTMLSLIIFAVWVSGCGKGVTKPPMMYEGRMRLVGKSGRSYKSGDAHRVDNTYIWVDTETGVCYLETGTGGICVLVDHNGKPFVANGWRDYDEGYTEDRNNND